MESQNFSNSNAIEVEGICFETLVPERSLISTRKIDPNVPLQFGIRISNQTERSCHFLLFYLYPEILDSAGKAIQPDWGSNATHLAEESDYALCCSGESLALLLNGYFYPSNTGFHLAINGKDGTIWQFCNLKVGTYQIRFCYKNDSSTGKIFRGWDSKGRKNFQILFEDVWTGTVHTPYEKLSLVRS